MYKVQEEINKNVAKILLENEDKLSKHLSELDFGTGVVVDFFLNLKNELILRDSVLDISNIHVVSSFMDRMATILKSKIRELFPEIGEISFIKNLKFAFNGKDIYFTLEDPSENTFTSIKVLLSGYIWHYYGNPSNMVITLRIDALGPDNDMCTMLDNTLHEPSKGFYEITGTVEQIFTILSIAKTNL